MMKLVLAVVALAVCIGFRNVNSGPVPSAKLAYPWTSWLALKAPLPPPGYTPAYFSAPIAPAAAVGPAPAGGSGEVSPDALANYLIARSILPAAPEKKKKKDKKKDSKEVTEDTDEVTTTKKPLIEVGDFWAPPTIAPNVTSPVVMDPAYWAAKKTMFISKLFAALAKQVLNSTGTVTTTTPSPDAALLNEIDAVLLTDVTRSVADDAAAPDAGVPPPSPKAVLAAMKKEAKKQAKAEKKAKAKAKTKGVPAFVLAKKKATTTAAPPAAAPTEAASASETETPHPTLDYALLAKALLS